jgi:hypothetical protein
MLFLEEMKWKDNIKMGCEEGIKLSQVKVKTVDLDMSGVRRQGIRC